MDGVYSCCDRTDSEGLSDIVAVEITEISQANPRSNFVGPVFDNKKRKLEDVKD